jgi:hypothetical protein
MSETDPYIGNLGDGVAAITARIAQRTGFQAWEADRSITDQESVLYTFLATAPAPSVFVVWTNTAWDEPAGDVQLGTASFQVYVKLAGGIHTDSFHDAYEQFARVRRSIQGYRPLPTFWGPCFLTSEAWSEAPQDDIIFRVFMLELKCEVHEPFADDVNE